jgi:hypothetical protein
MAVWSGEVIYMESGDSPMLSPLTEEAQLLHALIRANEELLYPQDHSFYAVTLGANPAEEQTIITIEGHKQAWSSSRTIINNLYYRGLIDISCRNVDDSKVAFHVNSNGLEYYDKILLPALGNQE